MEYDLRAEQYLELENIGIGAFAPLTGFMTEIEFDSVVDCMELPDGEHISIPIVLEGDYETGRLVEKTSEMTLTYQGEAVGILYPGSTYQM